MGSTRVEFERGAENVRDYARIPIITDGGWISGVNVPTLYAPQISLEDLKRIENNAGTCVLWRSLYSTWSCWGKMEGRRILTRFAGYCTARDDSDNKRKYRMWNFWTSAKFLQYTCVILACCLFGPSIRLGRKYT